MKRLLLAPAVDGKKAGGVFPKSEYALRETLQAFVIYSTAGTDEPLAQEPMTPVKASLGLGDALNKARLAASATWTSTPRSSALPDSSSPSWLGAAGGGKGEGEAGEANLAEEGGALAGEGGKSIRRTSSRSRKKSPSSKRMSKCTHARTHTHTPIGVCGRQTSFCQLASAVRGTRAVGLQHARALAQSQVLSVFEDSVVPACAGSKSTEPTKRDKA